MIKKVMIKPGCITCGLCEFLAPDVFEVTDISHVKPDASFNTNTNAIKKAVQECPVSVITYEESADDTQRE